MTQPASAPGPLATWGDRVVAALIDSVVLVGLYLVLFIVSLILRIVSDALATFVLVIGYLALSVYFLYLGYLEGQTGQSPARPSLVSRSSGKPMVS